MARPTLTVLDDGLFVRTYAHEVRPLSATFHRFVEAVARTHAFGKVRYVVPVRPLRIWEVEPALDPVDESVVDVVPTTYFSGIADYLARAVYLLPRNWPVISRAVGESDLVWLRLPASNALLTLVAARRQHVPLFGWVAGSAAQVAAAQKRAWPMRPFARAVGRAYDSVTRLAGASGPLLDLDAQYFASVVTEPEIAQTRAGRRRRSRRVPRRIVWAGRMGAEKGLLELIAAVANLLAGGIDAKLVLIGDGPARAAVERALTALPRDRVEDYGYVADRRFYMDLLRGGDVLVHPSGAEGVPKVIVEAMAAGLPVVAADAGSVCALLGGGERGVCMPDADGATIANAVVDVLEHPRETRQMAARALDWAAQHTAEAQARRLVDWLHEAFPDLRWTD